MHGWLVRLEPEPDAGAPAFDVAELAPQADHAVAGDADLDPAPGAAAVGIDAVDDGAVADPDRVVALELVQHLGIDIGGQAARPAGAHPQPAAQAGAAVVIKGDEPG